MDKNFDFQKHEALLNKKWLDGEFFLAKIDKNKKPFTIVMPPPNVTSRLHIGHAFGFTIKDILARFKRAQGFNVLLLPGADHAAIATENKVTEHLAAQGINKNDLSREEFLAHVNKWYDIYIGEITNQIKKMGVSCDWSRFAFTMDEATTASVKMVFDRLRERGFVYRGERMINWCPTCVTALCDSEVEHNATAQTMYEISFPFEIGGSEGVKIATVRPEVIPANAAVAVNPADKRYTSLVGKSVFLPIVNRKIPIIADASVDMKFGTGCLQITPAHSMADFDTVKKHNLEIPRVVLDTREVAVQKLRAGGFVAGEKKHTSNLSVCYRCKKMVEPSLSNQWFIKMDELAKHAITALEDGMVLLPKRFKKVWMHWANNLRDWCVSRQLLSGHKIPIEGETDVLDTWFSAALWPFSTLGWASDGADFEHFYPTQVMVMGYDILFFWAIRMVLMGREITGKIPFETVLFHGLVRDVQGRKMSKTLGNGVDPLEIIDEFGCDVLRFSLIVGTRLDRDPRYSLDRATLARNFINKIWNATKFFLHKSESKINLELKIKNSELSTADKWILTKLNSAIKNTTRRFEKFDFGIAANELQSFFWYDICDWYLESIKTAQNPETALGVFYHVLTTSLRLMNPIMPFVTEHILVDILGTNVGDWPVAGKNFPKEKKDFDAHIEFVKFERTAAKQKQDAAAQIKHLEKEIERGERVLGNQAFVAKAPPELVEVEKQKLVDNKKSLDYMRGLLSEGGDVH